MKGNTYFGTIIVNIFVQFQTMFYISKVTGEVTITANSVTKNNTDYFSQAIIVNGIGNDEVNEALYEWNPSTRTPGFDFYFKSTHSIAATILLSTLHWNDNRTLEERKDASGQVLCTAALNGNPVTSKMFSVSIQWKPSSSSLELEHAGDHIIRDSSLTLICNCHDKGNPLGNVVWVVNGDIKQGGRYINSTIVIDKVFTADNGEYKCYYQNGEVGMGLESETKPVDVMWQPGKATLVVTGSDDLEVKQGKRITLTCTGDAGNPMQNVLWIFNSFITETTTIAKRVFTVGPEHNGIWSCRFINKFGKGTESEGLTVTVLLTPLTPIIELIRRTAFSLTISLELSYGTNPDTGSYSHTNITLFGNGVLISTIHPASITEYTFDNLLPSTSYNVSVFYNNDVGDGEPALKTFTTTSLQSLYIEYVSYAFNESYVHFNLRLNDESAADTVNVQVCSTPHDEPLCSTASSKLEDKELTSDVELPEPSDHTLYNVTFIFSHGSRIVSRHGIALRGNEKQSSTSTIFAAVFGALWIITAGIAAVVIVLYHRRLKENDVNPPKEKEAEVQYVNVGAETGADCVTYNTSATEYEDVAREAAPIRAHNTENTTYMDLDQNDVQQTRNRPAELTVYQSLH